MLTTAVPTLLPSGGHALVAEARRVMAGVVGPAGLAAVQFAATMLLWGRVPAHQFGLFAFAMVLVQLSFGVSNALVGTPLSVGARDQVTRHRCLSAHALLLGAAGTLIPALLAVAGAGADAPAFGVLAVAANLRWAARSLALAQEQVKRSAASDAIQAASLAALLALAVAAGRLDVATLTGAMTLANLVALTAGGDFLRAQGAALRRLDLTGYVRDVWKRQSGWALGGVATTELASNAQAYAVTGLHGAAAFAPLAFGSLFCRPLTIFLTALTQVDRPIFARHRARGEVDASARLIRNAVAAASLAWLGNLALALAILALAGPSIAAHGYDAAAMRGIVLLWFAVMLMRSLRNPLSTALQAAGAFRALALCSAAASLVSVAAALALAFVDPLWSLAGTLLGETVLLAAIVRLHGRTR